MCISDWSSDVCSSDLTRTTGKPEEIASAHLDKPSVRRPILSVRTPVEAAEARASYVQRVVFEQHGPRDWTIFEQYARDANIALLEIQDPYCCADGQARGRLVNFISRFGQLASQIAAVHVVAFDADSVQTREPVSTNGTEEGRVGKEWVRRGGSRWAQGELKKN